MTNIFKLKTIQYLEVSEQIIKILERRFPNNVKRTQYGVILPEEIQKEIIDYGHILVYLFEKINKIQDFQSVFIELDMKDAIQSTESFIEKSETDSMKACKIDIMINYCFDLDEANTRGVFWLFMKYVRSKDFAKQICKLYFLDSRSS